MIILFTIPNSDDSVQDDTGENTVIILPAHSGNKKKHNIQCRVGVIDEQAVKPLIFILHALSIESAHYSII